MVATGTRQSRKSKDVGYARWGVTTFLSVATVLAGLMVAES
jgi:hypothetical protein